MSILEALATVGNVLDTPRAMAWQTVPWLAGKAGLREETDSPLEVALNPEKRPTGWDLRAWLADQTGAEWLQNKEGFDWLDPLTMGAELIGDPLNALMGFGAAKTAGKIGKAKAVAREAIEHNADRAAKLAQRWMPEEVAEKTLISSTKMKPIADPDVLFGLAEKHGLPVIRDQKDELARMADWLAMTGRENATPHEMLQYAQYKQARDEILPLFKREQVPARVLHGTAEVYDWPAAAATAERAYSRAGAYSRHPPLHFVTPDPETTEYYIRESAKGKFRNAPKETVQQFQKAMRDEINRKIGQVEDVLAKMRQPIIREDEFQLLGKRAEILRKRRNLLQDAGYGLFDEANPNALDILPPKIRAKLPSLPEEILPSPNMRMYYVDVRNPMPEEAWEQLAKKHGWVENRTLRQPGAADRALEEARAAGYDAIVSHPFEAGGPLPDEIAPFSTDQLFAPYIAPRAREVPKIPTNWPLWAMPEYNVGRAAKYLRPPLIEDEVL